MNLSFFIARKYFFSGKKRNFINVISIISLLIVVVCTASLIIFLSVFNGLEGLLRSMYNSFDPQLKIEAVKGKSFEVSPEFIANLEDIDGVSIVTEVIEDYAYARYRQSNVVVTIKGVSNNFIDQHRLDDALVAGRLTLEEDSIKYAIIGQGIQFALSINPGNDLYPLQLHYTKDVSPGQMNISQLYNKKNILVSGVFAIEKNYDERYIFVPLDFAQSLLDYGDKRTSIEIKLKDQVDLIQAQSQIIALLGKDFKVLTNDEQHADLYKLLNLEKLFVFLACVFVLVVGSINIFFALSMLAIDKKKDISILYSLGANNRIIKRIFLFEGAIISLSGAIIGLAIGGFICWLQENYGLVSMGMETSILENYPVEVQLMDFVYTFITIVLITFIISYRPAVIATEYNEPTTL